jgi:hypothetical protein
MKLSTLQNAVTVICISAFLSINAQETNAPKFGKGLFNLVGQDSTWTMKDRFTFSNTYYFSMGCK